jgi:hypothetical protein
LLSPPVHQLSCRDFHEFRDGIGMHPTGGVKQILDSILVC